VLGVVADSNVWVSALVFGGKPFQIIEMGLEQEINLVISPAILEETLGILKRKFAHTPSQLAEAQRLSRTGSSGEMTLQTADRGEQTSADCA
jgi:predicted nucleic acid-binding protein